MSSFSVALSRRATRETRAWVEREDGAERLETTLAGEGVEGLSRVLDRPAIPARWLGKAAGKLGLAGEATSEQLRDVLERGEYQGQKLRSRGVGNTSHGIVWAAPKSVSVLLAHPDQQVRETVDASIQAAGEAYIAALEELVRSRQGKEGVRSVPILGLIGAQYLHHTSSNGDPHGHVHILLSNTAPCEDGKWRALDGKTLFAAKRVAEAAANRAMKATLNSRLNLPTNAWGAQEVGSVQVPELRATRKIGESLSGARRHIADVLKDMGKTLSDVTFLQDRLAWKEHRRSKQEIAEKVEHELDAGLSKGGSTAEAIRAMWNDRTDGALGEALASITPKPTPTPPSGQVENPVEFWDRATPDSETGRALEDLENRTLAWIESLHSWTVSDVAARLTLHFGNPSGCMALAGRLVERWSERELVHAPAGVAEACRAIANRDVTKTELVHKAAGLHAKCTSRAAIEIEQQVEDQARDLANDQRQRLAVDVSGLTNEQSEAAALIAKGRGLAVISGVAGAGKTTMLAKVADAARKKDMRVVSVARNAARGVDTGQGISADLKCSIAALLKQPIEKWGARRPVLLVIDEGGVVDRDDWRKLLDLTKTGRVQIVAVGDRDQAQPIDRKAGWHLVQQGAAEANQHRHLGTSWRCKAWTDEASAIRAGDGSAVLKSAEGRVLGVAEDKIADEAAQRVHKNGAAVALTVSNSEAADISRRVQRLCGIEPTTPVAGDSFAGVGDRVRTRRNDHRLGLLNGDRWSVWQTYADGSIDLESEKGVVRVSAEYAREFVELDYAATVDSAQGITVNKAICVLREGTGRSYLYSAATRGRQAPEYLISGAQGEQAHGALQRIVETDDTAKTAKEIAADLQEAEPEKPEADEKPKSSEMDVSEMFESKERLVSAYQQQQRERDEARARQNPRFIDPVPRPRGMRPR